eukprot:549722-Hanusia_phi.AAC.5
MRFRISWATNRIRTQKDIHPGLDLPCVVVLGQAPGECDVLVVPHVQDLVILLLLDGCVQSLLLVVLDQRQLEGLVDVRVEGVAPGDVGVGREPYRPDRFLSAKGLERLVVLVEIQTLHKRLDGVVRAVEPSPELDPMGRYRGQAPGARHPVLDGRGGGLDELIQVLGRLPVVRGGLERPGEADGADLAVPRPLVDDEVVVRADEPSGKKWGHFFVVLQDQPQLSIVGRYPGVDPHVDDALVLVVYPGRVLAVGPRESGDDVGGQRVVRVVGEGVLMNLEIYHLGPVLGRFQGSQQPDQGAGAVHGQDDDRQGCPLRLDVGVDRLVGELLDVYEPVVEGVRVDQDAGHGGRVVPIRPVPGEVLLQVEVLDDVARPLRDTPLLDVHEQAVHPADDEDAAQGDEQHAVEACCVEADPCHPAQPDHGVERCPVDPFVYAVGPVLGKVDIHFLVISLGQGSIY